MDEISQKAITIAILTYQRPNDLKKVLENIGLQHQPPFEVLVIDNDPTQSGQNAIQGHPYRVQYYCPGSNLGVAGGRNFAAAKATGDILLFLDDDACFADEHALEKAVASFDDARVGCVAYLIRNAQTGQIVPREFPGKSWRRWQEPHDVSYFLGGACAVRRDLYLALGGFDDLLFYDGEEIEFSYRLLNSGYRIHYTPEVAVLHFASSEGRKSTKTCYWLIRNRLYVAAKHLPLPYRWCYMLIWSCYALWRACGQKDISGLLRGWRSLYTDRLLTKAVEYRRNSPLRTETLRYLRRHDGRLWY